MRRVNPPAQNINFIHLLTPSILLIPTFYPGPPHFNVFHLRKQVQSLTDNFNLLQHCTAFQWRSHFMLYTSIFLSAHAQTIAEIPTPSKWHLRLITSGFNALDEDSRRYCSLCVQTRGRLQMSLLHSFMYTQDGVPDHFKCLRNNRIFTTNLKKSSKSNTRCFH